MDNRTKGILATIFSAAFFGLLPLFVKTVIAGGANTYSMAFLRFFASVPFFNIWFKIKKVDLKITWIQIRDVVLLTVFGYSGTAVLLFSSYNYIPSGMSTTIHFLYPVVTIIACVIFLKEKVVWQKVLCVVLCVIGILLFYNGDGNTNVIGIILAACSSVTYTFYTVYLGRSSVKDMDSLKLIFYLNLAGSVMLGIICLATGSFTFHLTPLAWGVAIFSAFFTSLIGVLGYQIGLKYIGPQSTTILSTFEPITSVLIGIFVYSEPFTLKTVLGCISILSATVIIALLKEKDSDGDKSDET